MARAAEGSLRDALSLLEQARAYCGTNITDAQVRELLGVVPEEILDELTGAIEAQSAERVLALVHRLLAEGQNLQHFCREAIGHFRNLLVARVCGADSEFDRRARRRAPAAGQAAAVLQRRRPDAIFSDSAAHRRRSAPQARCAPASGNGPAAHGECRAPGAARRNSRRTEAGTRGTLAAASGANLLGAASAAATAPRHAPRRRSRVHPLPARFAVRCSRAVRSARSVCDRCVRRRSAASCCAKMNVNRHSNMPPRRGSPAMDAGRRSRSRHRARSPALPAAPATALRKRKWNPSRPRSSAQEKFLRRTGRTRVALGNERRRSAIIFSDREPRARGDVAGARSHGTFAQHCEPHPRPDGARLC